MKGKIFVYSQYPDLNYFLGEVGGYSGPGLGLLTCGIVLILFFYVWPDTGWPSPCGINNNMSGMNNPQFPGQMIRLFLRLTLASILGAGTGLLAGAMTYVVLLGIRVPTSEIAGFMACGLGSFISGIALLPLCIKTDNLPWVWLVGVVLFLLAGLALCSKSLVIALR